MGPTSFGILSMFCMGIGVESFFVLMFSHWVKSCPMKSPILQPFFCFFGEHIPNVESVFAVLSPMSGLSAMLTGIGRVVFLSSHVDVHRCWILWCWGLRWCESIGVRWP
jgi:hypothetical protein